MRYLTIAVALITTLFLTAGAQAGAVIDRIKARGYVRCGAAVRPGLAYTDGSGRWFGLEVDVCRAVAIALVGSPERISFSQYDTPKQYEAVAKGSDDLFFLTATEIVNNGLLGKLLPGPTVFVESDAVLVPDAAPAHHVSDLAGDSICYMIASSAERSLEAYFDGIHKTWDHRAFSEDGEMNDSYNSQHCHAVAGEVTTLAVTRLSRQDPRMGGRILPEPLTVFPILAVTATGDGQWSALVAWTVHTLISAERPETKWYAGGARAMPISGPELGLDKEWQKRVVKAVGNYGDIFQRNLGSGSPLKLERGYNANQINGGLLLSPFIE
jgi:general L-amino acid transport system substrate-binding protein